MRTQQRNRKQNEKRRQINKIQLKSLNKTKLKQNSSVEGASHAEIKMLQDANWKPNRPTHRMVKTPKTHKRIITPFTFMRAKGK